MPFNLHNPIAWVGPDKCDRLLLSDVTRFGLHRKVVARKGDCVDVEMWLNAVQAEAGGAEVSWWSGWWTVEAEEFCYLWMVWKEVK